MSCLIENGQVRLGVFGEPITVVRPSDFDFRSPLGRRAGRLKRHFAYKQFHYVGGISKNLIFGLAIVDVRILSTAFFYVYDLDTGREFRSTWRKPGSSSVQFSEDPERGPVVFGSGKNRATVTVNDGVRTAEIIRNGKLFLHAQFPDKANAVEPLRICTRAGYNGWVYVRKTGGVPLSGIIDCDLGKFDLKDCLGHTDYSTGFMRPETWWNWAFVSGRLGKKTFAMNLSCGVNETSFNENCCWIDGKLKIMPQTTFEFDGQNPVSAWKIKSSQSKIFDLSFAPKGVHKEHVNLGFLASRFWQMYGQFKGEVQIDSRREKFSDLWGFTEDHYAKW